MDSDSHFNQTTTSRDARTRRGDVRVVGEGVKARHELGQDGEEGMERGLGRWEGVEELRNSDMRTGAKAVGIMSIFEPTEDRSEIHLLAECGLALC